MITISRYENYSRFPSSFSIHPYKIIYYLLERTRKITPKISVAKPISISILDESILESTGGLKID